MLQISSTTELMRSGVMVFAAFAAFFWSSRARGGGDAGSLTCVIDGLDVQFQCRLFRLVQTLIFGVLADLLESS